MVDYTLPLDELPDPLPIVPLTKPFDVSIAPPGSKSITNRAYVLAALAEGESKIIRPLRSEDTDALLDALCTLGAQARWEGEDVFIKGVAGRFPRGGSVNLGDGGTPTRFLIAAACMAAEPVIVDGSARMRERPIAEGVDMLRQLGARIEYVEEEGRLPVRVVPSDSFAGGELTVGKTESSQFISTLMLIAPWLNNGIVLTFDGEPTSRTYIELTAHVLSQWGICLENVGTKRVIREAPVDGRVYEAEADASSAAYWWLAAALVPNASVYVPNLDERSSQPDAALLGLMQQFCSRQSGSIDAACAPDGAICLAVLAAQQSRPTTITGLHTLRVKETDRIAALANELRRVGCTVETTDGSITIVPPEAARDERSEERAGVGPSDDAASREDRPTSSSLRSSDAASGDSPVIETYNDHRMAMAFAVLGLVRPGIAIANPKCVAKSYPTFWRDFAKLYE